MFEGSQLGRDVEPQVAVELEGTRTNPPGRGRGRGGSDQNESVSIRLSSVFVVGRQETAEALVGVDQPRRLDHFHLLVGWVLSSVVQRCRMGVG